MDAPAVAVLADDLIWSTRLADLVAGAGSRPLSVRDLTGLAQVLPTVSAVIVDLTARGYDGVAAVEIAHHSGHHVLCVGQHDDVELRRRALAAGADRVSTYRALFEHGAETLGRWLATATAAPVRVAEGTVTETSAARPTIPSDRYGQRLADAARLAGERELDALLIGVGAELRWLTGYVALPLERLTMLVLPALGRPTLVVPRLEALPAQGSPVASAGLVDLATWTETEDAVALVASLVGDARRLAVSDRLWAMFLLRLQRAFSAASFDLASLVLRDLRIVKDDDEVALLRLAAHAADRVIGQMAAGALIGRTEADVSREIRERLVAEGHDSADFAIVGSGPNSASPHHEASERVIRAGEPLLLDIGGPLGGYGSDITRVLWLTGGDPTNGPDPEYRRLYDVLQEAQAEATAGVRSGVQAERVDAIGRGIIAGAGYGPNFIHRIGHGIGLEAHEEPYLVAGNAEPLSTGMAFSIEPGIYLEGRYGARIEDIAICGPNGAIVLNEAPRDLLVVDG